MFAYLRPYFLETKIILVLAIPLIASGVVEAAIGFFSTLFLAHLGPQELAAGALVNWVFFTMLVIIWGMFNAISVMVAQRFGAKNFAGIATVLKDGLLFAALITMPVMLLVWNIAPILLYFGQKQEMVLMAQGYLRALAVGVLPDLIFLVLQQFLIGLGHTRTSMFFTFIWVPFNIIANYILMFGKWGFPALGIMGIGWGTTASFWFIAILIFAYILLHKEYRQYLSFKFDEKIFTTWRELLRIGIPMGAMFSVEIAFFLTLTLVMGRIGVVEIAANQIVMQYLALFGMMIFCTAQAITVRVGHNMGANDLDKTYLSTICGTITAILYTNFAVIGYWFFPDYLISIDLNPGLAKNDVIITLVKEFFVAAAVFQWLEAIRFSLFGALRGLGDTYFTFWVSIIMFWGVALPLGYVLQNIFQNNGVGYWWGLALGALCGIGLLIWRLKIKVRQSYLTPITVG